MAKNNLISLADRPEAERRAIASAGGVASGKARRARARFRDYLETALAEHKLDHLGRDTGATNIEAMAARLVRNALMGNNRETTAAIQVILRTLGEDAPEETKTAQYLP